MLKAIILIGGPSNGTRFRPLSLDIPKPLFPVAGYPMIYHHIEAVVKLGNVKEIVLIGSYQKDARLASFMSGVQQEFRVVINYFQEYTALGNAGGLYHFRDQIMSGNPDLFFVMNADVCGDFPLREMLEFHKSVDTGDHFTILGTEATRQQSLNYGCIVEDKDTHKVTHYVEKPGTFVSTLISCGIFLFSPDIFNHIGSLFKERQSGVRFDLDSGLEDHSVIRMEQDIFAKRLPSTGKLFVYQSSNFWSQLKSAGAAIYANRHYLSIYRNKYPDRLINTHHHAVKGGGEGGMEGPQIIGDVYIHPSASVHHTACLGPNVTIERNAVIHAGVRIRESIVLEGAVIQSTIALMSEACRKGEDHCCILYSIVGWHSNVGEWTRIEGTPNDPNPDKPFAKLDIQPLFNPEGQLNPSITVIGSKVRIPAEVIVLNSIVLPDKSLEWSCKNQIML